jgi:hypothetical protein
MDQRMTMLRRTLGSLGRLWPTRWPARVVLIATVVGMHACVLRDVAERMIDLGVAAKAPARIELVVGRDMEISVPPPAAAAANVPVVVAAAPKPERQATPVTPQMAPAPAASAPKRPKPPKPPRALPLEPPSPGADATLVAAAGAASAVPDADPGPTIGIGPSAGVPAAPASAASAVGSGSVIGPVAAAPVVAVAASAASSGLAASAASAASAAAAGVGEFAWPPSTRITYELTGDYHGEVHGTAQVDWVRTGARYQVHLDLMVGPSFAPVLSRRMTSDGQLSDAGLSPERYDEDTKVAFRDAKHNSVAFEADSVLLSNGKRAERLPGMQDTASQFVQLTFLFTRHPELLTPGTTIEIPLAMPRRVKRWVYDVREAEVLYTGFGAISAIPLRPRLEPREPRTGRDNKKNDDLTAEVWFAPSLHYLPVRIRVQQSEDTFVDLMIRRKPQLAAK